MKLKHTLFATCSTALFALHGIPQWTTPAQATPVSLPLVEIAPRVEFLQTTTTVNSNPTVFWSYFNPGAVVRTHLLWRERFPLFFHFGVTQVTERTSSGVFVDGEHLNVKYLWSFGSRIGIPLAEDWMLVTGMEFNHEPFMRDTGGNTVFLNKILMPTLAASVTWNGWHSGTTSLYLEAGGRVYTSVPMDPYMVRNGGVLFAAVGTRFTWGDLALHARLIGEQRSLNTNIASVSMQNIVLEWGIGWGSDGPRGKNEAASP
jgi:hypothetical protein